MSIFFSWCMGQGLAQQNPASQVKAVKETKTAPKALSRREIQALIRAVAGAKRNQARNTAIITLLLHTGIRVSELCSLTIDDVIIKDRSGSLVVRSGKGTKRREVPLNVTARKALQEWLNVRADETGALLSAKKPARE